MMKLNILFYLPFFLVLLHCNDNKTKHHSINQRTIKEPLILANQKMVRHESKEINDYIKRRNYSMNKTGTGLRYMIYHSGNGPQAATGKFALVKYEVSLLNGNICYSSEKNGPEEFLIGQDDVESGLHEGILFLKVGDKAKMILPPHLAHGLIGDENKIPSNSTIIYDIELIKLR